MKRLEFTDAQKAYIYKRDHALCSFTGKSLWMLDYGESRDYEMDWVEHIIPASRGGSNDLDNGTLARFLPNYERSNSIEIPNYICMRGIINSEVKIPANAKKRMKNHINRFSKLTEYDWYLNRYLSNIGLAAIFDHEIKNGMKRSRDKYYWLSAASKQFKIWLAMNKKFGFDDLYARGLMPVNPTQDQTLLIKCIEPRAGYMQQNAFIKFMQSKM